MDPALLREGVDEIRKLYGSASVFQANEDGVAYKVDAISTGSFNIDDAIGVGGVPRGRLIMLSGSESSGKSLIALNIIKEAQKTGGIGYYIDAEHTLTVEWMKDLGLNPEGVLVSQEDDAEKAFELLLGKPATKNRSKPILGVLQNEKLLKGGLDKGVIVIDSLSQLVPPIERAAALGDHTMAAMARFLTPTLRRLVPMLHITGVTCVIILQMRLDPGQMFGDPRKVSGGQALKHSASVWLDVAKINGTEIVKDDEPIGHTIKVKIKKNKVAVPFKEAQAVIHYVRGIDLRSELAAQAIKRNIIKHPDGASEGSNSWVHPLMGRVVGMQQIAEAIASNKELAKSLHKEIIQHVRQEQSSKSDKLQEFDTFEVDNVDEKSWDDIEETSESSNNNDDQQSTIEVTTNDVDDTFDADWQSRLSEMTLTQLKTMANTRNMKGRHTMSKAELADALLPILNDEQSEKQRKTLTNNSVDNQKRSLFRDQVSNQETFEKNEQTGDFSLESNTFNLNDAEEAYEQ